ncbi:uncharacterized protein PRCAT00004740001 [Priceomyces carsonii]|uniref:uncharacterized protein n=1 Tax=Priceomyces carsonii TaxID=28549 RepID=UPI002EDB3E46|nr:unnamed protein product [Priceomyces carsonii]
MDIKENVQRINGHLTLSSEGRYRGTAPVDLGNDALNHLMALINQRFDNMERATAEKFDNMNQEIRYLVRQQNSSSARAENKFKGRGGEIESPSAYKDIANKDNKLPIDEGLERLHSMDQINSMTGPTVNNYLRFYDIATSGQVQERKKRLLQFVGVNVSTEVRETFGSGI